MNANLKEKLNKILSYPFFSSVGGPLPNTVSSITTWRDAAKNCNLVKWKNNKLVARNVLQEVVQARSWERMQAWNPICQEVDPIIMAFAENLVQNLDLASKDRNGVKECIVWDIGMICLEKEFEDLLKPFFYIPYLDSWYANGHFPCGWDGNEFPETWDGVIRCGKLMVF